MILVPSVSPAIERNVTKLTSCVATLHVFIKDTNIGNELIGRRCFHIALSPQRYIKVRYSDIQYDSTLLFICANAW